MMLKSFLCYCWFFLFYDGAVDMQIWAHLTHVRSDREYMLTCALFFKFCIIQCIYLSITSFLNIYLQKIHIDWRRKLHSINQRKLSVYYLHFYAPLEKGGILFCNCRSFWWSVDQVLSAQYLLTLPLDQYQTWCRGCPQWVDNHYLFSGHMFKGQGQTTLLSPLCCPLNIFLTLHVINTKLDAGVALNK